MYLTALPRAFSTGGLGRVARDLFGRRSAGLETGAFAKLVGGPANLEAIAAFQERREADFSKLPPFVD